MIVDDGSVVMDVIYLSANSSKALAQQEDGMCEPGTSTSCRNLYTATKAQFYILFSQKILVYTGKYW